MTFSLNEKTCTLTNVNLRAETHGDDFVSAADIKFQADMHVSDLAMFHPDLAASLYRAPSKRDKPANDPLPLKDDNPVPLSVFRFPQMIEAIKWGYEMVGAQAVIQYGMGDDKSNIKINAKTVKGFHLVPRDGGTVEVSFTVQSSALSEADFGKLSSLLRHEVTLWLNQSQGALDLDGKKKDDKPKDKPADPFKKSGAATDNGEGDAEEKRAAAVAKAFGIADPEQVDVGDQTIVPPTADANDPADPFPPLDKGKPAPAAKPKATPTKTAGKPAPKPTPKASPKPSVDTPKTTGARPARRVVE